MRTTLTIDDDLAKALKRRAQETGRSFKALVNEALADRAGGNGYGAGAPPVSAGVRRFGSGHGRAGYG